MKLYWLATSGVLLLTPAPVPYFTIDPSRYGGSTIPGSMSGTTPMPPMPQVVLLPPSTHSPMAREHWPREHPPVRRQRRHLDPDLPKDKTIAAELKRMNGLTRKGESAHGTQDCDKRRPCRALPGRQRIHR